MTELYAQHADGRKLFYPRWDSRGEIIPSKKLTVAVTIDRDGKTFPEGSVWIRKQRSWGLLDGWTLGNGSEVKKARKKRAPNASYLSALASLKTPSQTHT